MTHTPGPWRVGQSGSNHVAVYPNDGRRKAPICFCGMGLDEEHDEFPNAEANARLIAAAPDLLKALEEAEVHLVSFTNEWPELHKVVRRISAAIAKAKGETE